MKTIDPRRFNLSPRTVLRIINRSHIALVVSRKSRIIMKDGEKILEKVKKIKNQDPEMIISLETSAPICSKTSAFLAENGIAVVQI